VRDDVPDVAMGRAPSPVFDLYNGNRIIAYAAGASTLTGYQDTTNKVRDVDGGVGGAGTAFTPGGTHRVASPFINYSTPADLLAVVWQDFGSGFSTTIQYSACDSSPYACDDPFGTPLFDAPSTVVTGVVSNPQISHDGNREVVLYQEDNAAGFDTLFVVSRCVGDAWSAPQQVRDEPADTFDIQTIDQGTPNLVLNRVENLIHAFFVETDTADPESARTVHAWRSYQDCP
jgi:hypothetical protein